MQMIVFLLFQIAILFNLNPFTLVEASNRPSGLSSSVPELSTSFTGGAILSEASSTLTSRIDQVSPGPRRGHFSYTLLIDRTFDAEWKNTMVGIESLVFEQVITPTLRGNFHNSRIPPVNEIEVQNMLMLAINTDLFHQVTSLIANGARFLSNVASSRGNYAPIEMAVIMDRFMALEGMLQYLEPISFSVKSTLLGGLLIRAVQAGHLRIIHLLIEQYKAPYLKGSFLFQQSLIHKTPVNVVKYILSKFGNEVENTLPFGKYQDYAFHLAIKYNNVPAFNFLFSNTRFNRHAKNGDNLRPLNLIFHGQYNQFLLTLFTQFPEMRLAWIDGHGNNLLHLGILYQRFDFIKFALQALKFPVDCYNAQGQTALLFATILHNQQIAAYLLSVGASIFQADNSGVYPILLLACQNDPEAFIFVLETIVPSNIPDFKFKITSLTRTLILDQYWWAVNALFSKFPYLSRYSYLISQEHLTVLRASPTILDLPFLLDYLIDCKFIDPKPILFQAVCLGKLGIVKIVLKSGVSPALLNDFGESVLTLAIKNNQTTILRFLLSLGGWVVRDTLPNSDFIAIITNGASFLPLKLLFESRAVILTHFINYFLLISETLQFNQKELITVCIQLEIFLFHHVTTKPYTPNLLINLPTLINIKKIVAESIQYNNRLLNTLLTSIHMKNHQFIRNIISDVSAHQIKSDDLICYIDFHLIQEYNSIIN